MSEGSSRSNDPSQSEEEIVWIIEEARKVITGASGLSGAGGSGDSGSGAMGSSMDLDDLDVDYDDDIDTGDFVCTLWPFIIILNTKGDCMFMNFAQTRL